MYQGFENNWVFAQNIRVFYLDNSPYLLPCIEQ